MEREPISRTLVETVEVGVKLSKGRKLQSLSQLELRMDRRSECPWAPRRSSSLSAWKKVNILNEKVQMSILMLQYLWLKQLLEDQFAFKESTKTSMFKFLQEQSVIRG